MELLVSQSVSIVDENLNSALNASPRSAFTPVQRPVSGRVAGKQSGGPAVPKEGTCLMSPFLLSLWRRSVDLPSCLLESVGV